MTPENQPAVSLKRFDPIQRFDQGGTARGDMKECADGDYVKYEVVKLCVEACQRIARDFADGSFDGVTVGAIEDAVSAAKKLEN